MEPAGPPSPVDDVSVQHCRLIAACRTKRTLLRLSAMIGRPVTREGAEPDTWALAGEADSISVTDYIAAEEWLQAYASRVAGWWAEGGICS